MNRINGIVFFQIATHAVRASTVLVRYLQRIFDYGVFFNADHQFSTIAETGSLVHPSSSLSHYPLNSNNQPGCLISEGQVTGGQVADGQIIDGQILGGLNKSIFPPFLCHQYLSLQDLFYQALINLCHQQDIDLPLSAECRSVKKLFRKDLPEKIHQERFVAIICKNTQLAKKKILIRFFNLLTPVRYKYQSSRHYIVVS